MASIFQGVGAATSLTSSNLIDCNKLQLCPPRSFSERKVSFVVVRCGGVKMDGGSNRIGGRADQLVTNAVAAKADVPAAAAASKPG
ncbi:hypothetical protein M8C21_019360 [Ambrosia artemisiifolia]|uniref:Uncharacterized protein n=1 Tax=Ambrosia artemisiifolia TaxID=4212 RepID=A0AAD5CFX0_AMBAR|nr:hypothetical protein M8C21_019360 [Ambrosia artemisiifolia]